MGNQFNNRWMLKQNNLILQNNHISLSLVMNALMNFNLKKKLIFSAMKTSEWQIFA